VASEIRSRPLMAFDAVVRDTPARCATSVSVGGRPACTAQVYALRAGRTSPGWENAFAGQSFALSAEFQPDSSGDDLTAGLLKGSVSPLSATTGAGRQRLDVQCWEAEGMERGHDAVGRERTGLSERTPSEGPVRPTSSAAGTLHPLGLLDVTLAEGSLLSDWQRRNSAKTIPHCIQQLVGSGAVRNLEQVADGRAGHAPHHGLHFSDSDVYKVLEACAWDSARGLPAEIEEFADSVGSIIARAQREDGYVNSWFQGQHPELVWKDLRWGHELYCAGHLVQAAVADNRAGGSRLSAVAERLLEHLFGTFSLEEGDGRLVGVCGHPEIETALVEFYRLTGDPRALRFAARQVELRGQPDVSLPAAGVPGDSRFPLSYFLHHLPVRTRTAATGHAVRELYLQAGVVDVAVETNEDELLRASEAIWDDLYSTKTYITGAHGSRHRDESIGDPYELPSDRAYAETCAGIASFQWNWRLLLATGRARYADAMERVFWNTIAGAISLNGTEFFYSNTLHLRTGHDDGDPDSPRHRLGWYECPCCPPNLARLMASIQAYLVTRDASGLQVHMPFSGTIATKVPGGTVELSIRTEHPWGGSSEIEVISCRSADEWQLSLRMPKWTGKDHPRLLVNGRPHEVSPTGSYLTVKRRWSPGDHLQVSSDMLVRLVQPHWRADAVRGCLAVQRGPLVYCLEAEDLEDGATVEDVALDVSTPLTVAPEVPAGLDGYVAVAVRASGTVARRPPAPLYQEGARASERDAVKLTFVPYFARSNRPSPEMRVWVPASGPA
jgi:DUF1680 family protein